MQSTSSEDLTLGGKSTRGPHFKDLINVGGCLDLSTASEDLLSPSVLSTWLIPAAGGAVPASETDRWVLPSSLSPVDDLAGGKLAVKSEAIPIVEDGYSRQERPDVPETKQGFERLHSSAAASLSLEGRSEKQSAVSPITKQRIPKRAMDPRRQSLALQKMFEVTTQDEGLLDSEDVFQLTHRSATVVTDHSLEGPEVALNMSFHAAIDPGDMSQTPVVFGVKALGLPRAQAQRKHASTSSVAKSKTQYGGNQLRESMALFLQLEAAVTNTPDASNRLPVLQEGLEYVEASPDKMPEGGPSLAATSQPAPSTNCLGDQGPGAKKHQPFFSPLDSQQPGDDPRPSDVSAGASAVHNQDTGSPPFDAPLPALECESPRLEGADRGKASGAASSVFTGAVHAGSNLEQPRVRAEAQDVEFSSHVALKLPEPGAEWISRTQLRDNGVLESSLEGKSVALAAPGRQRDVPVTRSVAQLVERFSPKPQSSLSLTPRTSITPKKHAKTLFWEQLAVQQEQERALVSPLYKQHRSSVRISPMVQPASSSPIVSPATKQAKLLPWEKSPSQELHARSLDFSPQASPSGPSPARSVAPLRASSQFLGSKNKILSPMASPAASDKSRTPNLSPLVDPLRTPSHSKRKSPSPLLSPLCSGPLRMFPPSPLGAERAHCDESRTSPTQSATRGSCPGLTLPLSPGDNLPQQHRIDLAIQSPALVGRQQDGTTAYNQSGHARETSRSPDSICKSLSLQSPHQSPAQALGPSTFTAADLRAQWTSPSALRSGAPALFPLVSSGRRSLMGSSPRVSPRRTAKVPEASDVGQDSVLQRTSDQPPPTTLFTQSSPIQSSAPPLTPDQASKSPLNGVRPSPSALACRSPSNQVLSSAPGLAQRSPLSQTKVAASPAAGQSLLGPVFALPAGSRSPSLDTHLPASGPHARYYTSPGERQVQAPGQDTAHTAMPTPAGSAASDAVPEHPLQSSNYSPSASPAPRVEDPLQGSFPGSLSMHGPPAVFNGTTASPLQHGPAMHTSGRAGDNERTTTAVQHSTDEAGCHDSNISSGSHLTLIGCNWGKLTTAQQTGTAEEMANDQDIGSGSDSAVTRSKHEVACIQTSSPGCGGFAGASPDGSHTWSSPMAYQVPPGKEEAAVSRDSGPASKSQLEEGRGSLFPDPLTSQMPGNIPPAPQSPRMIIPPSAQSPRLPGNIPTGLKSLGLSGNAAAVQVPRVLELQKDTDHNNSQERNCGASPLAGKAAYSAIPAGPSSRLRQPSGTGPGYGPIRQSSRLSRATRAQEDLPLTKQGGAVASLIPLPQPSNLPKPVSDGRIPKSSNAWLSRSAARLGLPGWKRTPNNATSDLPGNGPTKGRGQVQPLAPRDGLRLHRLGQGISTTGEQQSKDQSLVKPTPSPRDAENNPKAGNVTKQPLFQAIPSGSDVENTWKGGNTTKKRPTGKVTQKLATRAATPELDPHIAALLENPDLAFGGRGGGVVNSPLDAKKEVAVVQTAADRHYIEGGWDGVPLC